MRQMRCAECRSAQAADPVRLLFFCATCTEGGSDLVQESADRRGDACVGLTRPVRAQTLLEDAIELREGGGDHVGCKKLIKLAARVDEVVVGFSASHARLATCHGASGGGPLTTRTGLQVISSNAASAPVWPANVHAAGALLHDPAVEVRLPIVTVTSMRIRGEAGACAGAAVEACALGGCTSASRNSEEAESCGVSGWDLEEMDFDREQFVRLLQRHSWAVLRLPPHATAAGGPGMHESASVAGGDAGVVAHVLRESLQECHDFFREESEAVKRVLTEVPGGDRSRKGAGLPPRPLVSSFLSPILSPPLPPPSRLCAPIHSHVAFFGEGKRETANARGGKKQFSPQLILCLL